jgi:hypothetical protein
VLKIYVNGVRQALTITTQVSQNQNTGWNHTYLHKLGAPGYSGTTNNTWDGHLAEINHIDGQELDPSYFGYSDPITNIWQPKKYTGGYGTNGFYLPFSENLSTTNLGRNFAGSNHFTYSQAGTDASYVYNNASGTANFTTAPDGTLTATKLTIDSSNTTHRFYKQYSVLTSGAVAVVSAYVKALPGSLYNVVAIESWTGSAGGQAYFNLSTGQPQYSAAWPAGSGFQYVGDGWYRIWTTFANATSNGSGSPSIGIYMADNSNGLTYTGNGTAGFYFWGVQANLGTTPDNYIPTTSAASINNWTPTNFSLTAGNTYDSMVDSPTNVFTTATDIGGVVPGNYCTWNPVNSANVTLTNGNLGLTNYNAGSSNQTAIGTIGVTSGKWYFEYVVDTSSIAGGHASAIGVVVNRTLAPTSVTPFGGQSNNLVIYGNLGRVYKAGSVINDLFSWPVGSVLQIALDVDEQKIWFGIGGTWYNSGNPATGVNPSNTTTSLGTGLHEIITSDGASVETNTNTVNFGQRPFAYAPPAGFKSLNTTNLQALGSSAVGNAAITPNKWFDTVLYGGTGTARTITNPGGFVPDLVWTKVRNTTYSHNWSDSARGAGVRLSSDTTAVEGANANGGVTSFNTTNNNGYNIDGGVEVNENVRPYVSWQWKASPTSGFNIVPYTGTGVARSISHNLGVAPRFMIVKQRDVAVRSWAVYHAGLSNPQQAFYLDSTAAPFAYTAFFNNTAPTSSNFSLGTDATVNQSGSNYIAYIWAEVPGFSKFGNYVGNGSADGSFVYTGFRPRFIIFKRTDTTGSWFMEDSSRGTYNVMGPELYSNQADAEATSNRLDFVSNGFKMRAGNSGDNASGGTYIYIAFAESPFALNNRAR